MKPGEFVVTPKELDDLAKDIHGVVVARMVGLGMAASPENAARASIALVRAGCVMAHAAGIDGFAQHVFAQLVETGHRKRL